VCIESSIKNLAKPYFLKDLKYFAHVVEMSFANDDCLVDDNLVKNLLNNNHNTINS